LFGLFLALLPILRVIELNLLEAASVLLTILCRALLRSSLSPLLPVLAVAETAIAIASATGAAVARSAVGRAPGSCGGAGRLIAGISGRSAAAGVSVHILDRRWRTLRLCKLASLCQVCEIRDF